MFVPFGLLAPKDFYIIWFSGIFAVGVRGRERSRNTQCVLS